MQTDVPGLHAHERTSHADSLSSLGANSQQPQRASALQRNLGAELFSVSAAGGPPPVTAVEFLQTLATLQV